MHDRPRNQLTGQIVRHATRFGHPGIEEIYFPTMAAISVMMHKYLYSRGKDVQVDLDLGLRRAHAIIMLILGLPGSTYIYQ